MNVLGSKSSGMLVQRERHTNHATIFSDLERARERKEVSERRKGQRVHDSHNKTIFVIKAKGMDVKPIYKGQWKNYACFSNKNK